MSDPFEHLATIRASATIPGLACEAPVLISAKPAIQFATFANDSCSMFWHGAFRNATDFDANMIEHQVVAGAPMTLPVKRVGNLVQNCVVDVFFSGVPYVLGVQCDPLFAIGAVSVVRLCPVAKLKAPPDFPQFVVFQVLFCHPDNGFLFHGGSGFWWENWG